MINENTLMINEDTLKELGLVISKEEEPGTVTHFVIKNEKFGLPGRPVYGVGTCVESAFLSYVKALHKETSRLTKIEESLEIVGYYFGK